MSPATQSGKHKSSRPNTIESLYFAAGNFVRPEEEQIWKDFNTSFWRNFAPVGAVEAFLTTEIVRAAWRVRRCNNVEATLINRLSDPALDPMEDPATIATQHEIDRARTQAEHSFERSIAELRRVQTERQFRNESFPEGTNLATFGVASFKQILPAIGRKSRAIPFKTEIARFKEMAEQGDAELKSAMEHKAAAHENSADFDKTGGTPRNAPCPCGSGQKHKRCCGNNAPAVLGVVANLAA
jgi:hypothetical protein